MILRTLLVIVLLMMSVSANAQTTPAGVKNGGRVTTWSALSEAQKSFLISHYTSVTLGQWATSALSEIRAGNSSMFVSIYIAAPAAHVGAPMYIAADPTESLFAHDSEGNRIDSLVFDEQMMNPDATGWQDICVDYVNNRPGFDAIFIDLGAPSLNPLVNWPDYPAGYTDAGWKTKMLSFFAAIQTGTDGYVVYNGLHEGYKTGGYHASVDGGVIEGFCFASWVQTVNWTRIAGHITDVIQTGIDGLIAGANPAIDSTNATQRRINLASYLLAAHSASSLIIVDINDLLSSPQWWPEYEVNIGTPLTEHQTLVSMLDVSGLYVRQYSGGLVLVNPTGASINYNVERASYSMGFTGGGVVSELGVTDAVLTKTLQANIVTVPANDALILEYQSGTATPTSFGVRWHGGKR